MAQPFIGEIRLFGGNFAPAGWAFCDGRTLPISEYETLFNLIGTTYGGDGQETFVLPDLRGRVPIHQGATSGQSFQLAETGGVESVTLTTQQIPVHTHSFNAANVQGTDNSPAGRLPAVTQNVRLYTNETTDGAMAAGSIAPSGGSQPHDNLQPYLTVSYIISLFGIFPFEN
jgi:microcystin-dependent protein